MRIMADDPGSQAVRLEWGERVKVIRPVMAEDKARRAGIDRPQVAETIRSNFEGFTTGVYREGIELIPIITRAIEPERLRMEDLRDLQIYSPTAQTLVPTLAG